LNEITIIILGILASAFIVNRVTYWKKQKTESDTKVILSVLEFVQRFQELEFEGGTLRFWGNWFGKPMDNYHQIKDVKFDSVLKKLILILNEGEKIKIWNPSELKLGKTELRIEKADKILFEWNYYGEEKSNENLRFESYINNGEKIVFETDFRDNQKKANCNLNEPAFRIIGM
jgi:hypothetical protein